MSVAASVLTTPAAAPVLRSMAEVQAGGASEGRSATTKTARRAATLPSGATRTLRLGGLVQVVGSLFWVPQAAMIALAIQSIADGSGVSDVLVPAGIVLATGIAKAALDMWGARLCFRAARETLSSARSKAVAALAAGSPLDMHRAPSGFAASVVGEQAEALVPYLARYQPAQMRATIVPLALLCAVAFLSWVAAIILLVALPLIPIFMALVGWRAQAASEEQLAAAGGMNAFLLDRLRGLATIRTLGAIDLTARRLRNSADDLKARTMAVLRIAFLSSAVLELFSALGVAMTAVYIGFHLLGTLQFGAWGSQLSLGQGLFILLLAPAVFEPMRELASVWHDRASGKAALLALGELARPTARMLGVADVADRQALRSETPPTVQLSQIGFRHSGSDALAIDGFSLAVAAGERVALLGPSGSGKSTLLALIAGLAVSEHGAITVDGVKMTGATAHGLRARMAWIGQNPHFFSGSLRENISMGRDGISTSAIDGAIRLADLEAVARLHANGGIGESGAGLSGGEALRLALARAAADPSIDLILADEPTAHLDATTAHVVTEGLLALAEGRTMIVATHDPVLAARMDRIVRLEALT